MEISEQFKLFNFNKKLRKLCICEVGGSKWKKKGKKKHFVIRKNVFSLLLYFGYFFGFAFQRWVVKLEKVFL
jgi:hypothetical protein